MKAENHVFLLLLFLLTLMGSLSESIQGEFAYNETSPAVKDNHRDRNRLDSHRLAGNWREFGGGIWEGTLTNDGTSVPRKNQK